MWVAMMRWHNACTALHVMHLRFWLMVVQLRLGLALPMDDSLHSLPHMLQPVGM
jgi:hypothetical protein